MGDNVIIQFLKELVNRFIAKNPKFFNVIAWIGAAAAIISKLPEALALLGINLPEAWQPLANDIWFWAGVVAVFISNLAVAKPVVAVKASGETTTSTNPQSFPFTAQAEKDQAKGK